MKRKRRPFLKQKPVLYFDENVPAAVIDHFRKGSRWKKKIKCLSAVELGNRGRSDGFHFQYCSRQGYTLVSHDTDFNDEDKYPFANGSMHGVVMVKETKNNVRRSIGVLSNLLDFILVTPFPKSFMLESKFVISGEGCVMRGRDAKTKEVKSLQIEAGKTRLMEVRRHFSYF
jgi:predicted nuclease of predicted toxin-antitoxin system